MKMTPTALPEVLLIEPSIFEDERGFFFESFHQEKFEAIIGTSVKFVQDNQSFSLKNVLRGLHYQIKQPQAKLVRVTQGIIIDIAVDIRPLSPNFGQWISEILSAENKKQLWIPPEFAHGFLVVSDHAEVLYKTTAYWAAKLERSIRWNDPDIDIKWPTGIQPLLSKKDAHAPLFKEAEL